MTNYNDEKMNEEKVIEEVEEEIIFTRVDDQVEEEKKLDEIEEEILGEDVKSEKRSGFDKFLHSAKTFVKDAKLQEKFETLKEKTGEAVDVASKKIDEIRHDEELKGKLNTIKENVVSATEKSVEYVSNKVEEVRENPDVQKKVEQAKDKTIEVAEKAVDGLKKWLKPEDNAPVEDAPVDDVPVEDIFVEETPLEAPVDEYEVKKE